MLLPSLCYPCHQKFDISWIWKFAIFNMHCAAIPCQHDWYCMMGKTIPWTEEVNTPSFPMLNIKIMSIGNHLNLSLSILIYRYERNCFLSNIQGQKMVIRNHEIFLTPFCLHKLQNNLQQTWYTCTINSWEEYEAIDKG